MSASLINFPKRQNYVEFFHREPVEVVVASTVNVNIATLADSDTMDQVTLATNDLVLLKDQTNTEENGVYIIGAVAGTTVRATGAETADELNGYVVRTGEGVLVNPGSGNRRKFYYQNSVVVNVDVDPVTWSDTPSSFKFTVPGGVYYLVVKGCGAGGAGGASSSTSSSNGGGSKGSVGGGGGAGGVVDEIIINVTPGQILDIDPGKYSRHGVVNSYNGGANGAPSANMVAAADGADSLITGIGVYAIIPGGKGGASSNSPGLGNSTYQAGGSETTTLTTTGRKVSPGGANGGTDGDPSADGNDGIDATVISPYNNTLATGGADGSGAKTTGGGAGGTSIGVGGNGGNAASGTNTNALAFDDAQNGQGFGGGGGGAGSGAVTMSTNIAAREGRDGGFGYCGYFLITW